MKKLFIILLVILISLPLFAGKKLQDYPAIGTGVAVDADLLRIEDMSASAGSRTKKILLSSLISYIYGTGRTMSGSLSMGINQLSGANLAFTGGTLSGMTSIDCNLLDVDDIRINGYTISSTASNQDITITPDGTGEINVAAGDLNYAGTTILTTGLEINKLDGVVSQVVGISENHAQNYVTATGASVSLSGNEGVVNFDTTSNAITGTCPNLSTSKSEEYLCTFGTDGGNDVTIIDGLGDSGFTEADGTKGTSITLDDAGDFIFLKSCAISSGYWMIIGGAGYTLTP